ncbi:X-ray repair cross-complementing protein 5-like [Pollicipes pollicipes]|uniref:X-ray repair cross-complementing protein 5-like n=1 Tax=Pollicipes pollicipes TaxID=41117 RepID=UPI001885A271|nr:X-ray repair cross-complementing protein 5-like [Pollicipes pollicipes]
MCRLVARRNDTPHLVALQPQPEVVSDGVQTAPPGFHVIYLPFADDVRQLSLPAPRRATDEQIEAARAIVTKLRFKYAPEKIENPQLQKHWINIEALALNRPDVEEFTDYTAPDVERIRKNAGPLIEKFQELVYPEGYDPLAKSKPRAPAAKRPKLDPDAVDVRALALEKKVHTTTMPVLKAFLQDAGVSVSGLKKADLVQGRVWRQM